MSLPLNVSIVPMIPTTPPCTRHPAAIAVGKGVLASISSVYLTGNGLLGGGGRDR